MLCWMVLTMPGTTYRVIGFIRLTYLNGLSLDFTLRINAAHAVWVRDGLHLCFRHSVAPVLLWSRTDFIKNGVLWIRCRDIGHNVTLIRDDFVA